MISNKKNFFHVLLCLQTVCSYTMEKRKQPVNTYEPVAKKQCALKNEWNNSEEYRIDDFLSQVRIQYEEDKRKEEHPNKRWVNGDIKILRELQALIHEKKELEEQLRKAENKFRKAENKLRYLEERNIEDLFEDAKKTIFMPPVYRISCNLHNILD